MNATPSSMAVIRASDGPVFLLALFRAVSLLLAPATQFCGTAKDFEAEGTVLGNMGVGKMRVAGCPLRVGKMRAFQFFKEVGKVRAVLRKCG